MSGEVHGFATESIITGPLTSSAAAELALGVLIPILPDTASTPALIVPVVAIPPLAVNRPVTVAVLLAVSAPHTLSGCAVAAEVPTLSGAPVTLAPALTDKRPVVVRVVAEAVVALSEPTVMAPGTVIAPVWLIDSRALPSASLTTKADCCDTGSMRLSVHVGFPAKVSKNRIAGLVAASDASRLSGAPPGLNRPSSFWFTPASMKSAKLPAVGMAFFLKKLFSSARFLKLMFMALSSGRIRPQ